MLVCMYNLYLALDCLDVGKVETTSSTYKYKMQVQGSDSTPSTPSKQSPSREEHHTQLQVEEKSSPQEMATTELNSSNQESSTPQVEASCAHEEAQVEAGATESSQS